MHKSCVNHSALQIIVVSRFLERALCPALFSALKPGGLLFYQTFLRDRRAGSGPKNPRFLLAHNELPELFRELLILAYEEGDEALLVGRKR